MSVAVPGLELAVTKAPAGAVVSLILILASAVLFTIGWRLAVRRRYRVHRRVQTVAVCLNAVVVLVWMIRSLRLNVIPELPDKLGETSYAVATVHAVVGIIGLVLGVWVVLVASGSCRRRCASPTSRASCAAPTPSTCSAR